MAKSFDFKGRLNGGGTQRSEQAAAVVNTLAGREGRASGWAAKFQVLDIPLLKLHEYPEQSVFSMNEDELEQLTENVRASGILQPLIVRVHPQIPGDFQIIAGHRRREAARRAGMETVPCQVYMGMTDEEARTVFYATNMGQRTELLPSERAAGYQALAGALRLEGSGAVDAVAQAGSEGRRTVYRYMRLNNLEKPLLDKVDKKEISVYAGAALAALSATAQLMEDAARQAGLTVQRDQDKPGAAYFDADQNVIHVSDAGSEEDVRLSELKGYADAVIQRTATVEQPVRDLESASLAVMLAARYDVGVSDRLSQQLASAHAEAVKCPTFDLPVTLQRLDKALDYCDHFLAHEQERALEQEAENEPEPEQVTELSPQSQAFMMDL